MHFAEVESVPKLIAKCGIDCGTCPWGPYPRKGMAAQEFERYRSSAKTILGYMPIRTPCLTCQTPDSKIPKGSKLPNRQCLIRRCVDKTGVSNCAYCSRFPCDTLKATAGVWNRRIIEERLCTPISEEDYRVFVEPFEGLSRLESLRVSLRPEEIVEPAKAQTFETNIMEFPNDLSFSKEDVESFRSVYGLLTAIKRSPLRMRDTDTFAQHHRLENRRVHVLRFLWILGRYGKLEKERTMRLAVDAGTFVANRGSEKTLAMWPFVKGTVLEVLSDFGVCCERVTSKGAREEDLTTGTGYLRGQGWSMAMSLEGKAGGAAALYALQTYTRRLDEAYAKKAFRSFSDANMQILSKKLCQE